MIKMIKEKRLTSKDLILNSLWDGKYLAVHEIAARIRAKDSRFFSENNIATRVSELARVGKLIGRIREKTNYKEWSLPTRINNEQPLLFKGT